MPVAPSLLSISSSSTSVCEVSRCPALSRRPLLARHPFANVGGTTRDPNALCLAPHQESHRPNVHETDFNQVEDDVSTAFLLDRPAELGQLLGADSAAHGQSGGAGVNGTNDPEHRD